MSESTVHRLLIASLFEDVARNHGAVTHASGVGTSPDPPCIGRHEPDVLARAADTGILVIGEAKTGEDLFEERSLEQLADFSTHIDTKGQRAVLLLAVPLGWRAEAERAVGEAGGSLERTTVIEVSLPTEVTI